MFIHTHILYTSTLNGLRKRFDNRIFIRWLYSIFLIERIIKWLIDIYPQVILKHFPYFFFTLGEWLWCCIQIENEFYWIISEADWDYLKRPLINWRKDSSISTHSLTFMNMWCFDTHNKVSKNCKFSIFYGCQRHELCHQR